MTCHSCHQPHTGDSRIHLRGAYIYCMGCVPVNDAPDGIVAALKSFASWLMGVR